jgi:hypothetical protein
VAIALALPPTALADLQEFLFNLNGTLYHNDSGVPGLNSAAFDYTTGLGTLTLTHNPGVAGAYFFDVFFDLQLHAPFYNEYGSVNGAPSAGLSWQIDEPGFGDANRLGTIFDNASNNALDNTNHIPGTLSNFSNDCGANGGGAVNPACNNDVSMALGFNYILAADEQAIITLTAGIVPPAGFYLRQHDPDTPSDVYLTGAISIQPTTTVIPEPGSWVLFGTIGLILGGALRRRLSAL